MEKETKMKEKTPKVKRSKYPEGYIGRPKPMKTKTFEFHKPTKKFYIEAAFVLVILGFLTYIVMRLVQVGKAIQPEFEYFEYNADKQPESYILENKNVKFELDPETTQFTVLQKNTGKIWYSNPPAAKSDPIALTKEKNNMQSPLLIKYSTENGTDDIYDIYSNSIQRKFYTVSKKGDELRVDYTVGQMDREYIFPLIMYQSDFDKWTEGLSKSQVNAVSRAYHTYKRSSFKNKDELDAMVAKYPKFEDETLYLVWENIQTFLKVQMEELFAKQGFTYEDYLENKELYKETNIKEMPAFNVSVVYKLTPNGFEMTIPYEDISYRIKYPITQVSTLPYFGAATTSDKGFILIPEGGGSIINFNNGKTKQNGYYADCYGWDYAMDRKAVITETRASFPVFGLSYEQTEEASGSSFISIITKGAEYAGITAEISGKLGSYNYGRVDYKMLHSEEYEVTARSQNSQFCYEKQLPQGEVLTQQFIFVDSSSYVDMAKEYRKILFPNAKKTTNKEIPVAIEVVGAIDKVQQVAGMPKTKPYKLTSYSETADIVKQVEEMGIKNVNYRLSGFINGGIRQKMMNKVKFVSQLGGKSDFKRMLKDTSDTSAKFYLDGSVQTSYRSNIFDGFFSYRDAARFVSNELGELNEYSEIWYGKNKNLDSYYLLEEKLRNKGSDILIKNAEKYGLTGISYRDNGKLLSSDFNERNLTTRGKSKLNQIEKINQANEKGLGVMINSGNDYAVDKVDFITNMSLHGNSYAIIDKVIPFYQIALHGYVNYSGSAVNICYEKDQMILESAETGAGLFFTFMNEKEKALQETNYTEYYSSNFDEWKAQLADVYTKYNTQVGKVSNSLIVEHEYLSDQVTRTEFDNGYEIFVNFGYKGFTTPTGKYIPDRDYRVMKVED